MNMKDDSRLFEPLERIENNGEFIGWIQPYYKMVRVYRATFKKSQRPVFYAVLPSGQKTEFTLPTRKQATEWLKEAFGYLPFDWVVRHKSETNHVYGRFKTMDAATKFGTTLSGPYIVDYEGKRS